MFLNPLPISSMGPPLLLVGTWLLFFSGLFLSQEDEDQEMKIGPGSGPALSIHPCLRVEPNSLVLTGKVEEKGDERI